MNLVRGVALIGVAGACCGATPDSVNSLSEKSGGRVAIVGLPGGGLTVQLPAKFLPAPFPKALEPWKILPNAVWPKSQFENSVPMPIPTEITGHAELIPTQWPNAQIVLCTR